MADDHISWVDAEDPAMAEAVQRAQETFRYFWREVSWDARRIIKACDMAAVKVAFWDPSDPATVEHMWLGEVGFDGLTVSGKLLNSPNRLVSVKAGDRIEVAYDRLMDWMYVMNGVVFGAYTVNLIRAMMAPGDRHAHDEAWGLDFGHPSEILLAPFDDADAEHPLSEAGAPGLAEQVASNPRLREADDGGWTMLHHQAMAGNLATVEVLLAAGFDRDAKTPDGRTARDLADFMGWNRVVARLDA